MAKRNNQRPTMVKWNAQRPQQGYELALLGATLPQMARVFGCSLEAVNYWMRHKVDFRDAVERGRLAADGKVAEALYKCAIGYEYSEKQVLVVQGQVRTITVRKKMQPSAWAASRWLSMRQRALWGTKPAESGDKGPTTNINILQLGLKELSTEELQVMEKLGLMQHQQRVLEPSNGNGDSDTESY